MTSPNAQNVSFMDKARFNMIEQQIRTWDVLDERVLELLKILPREDFVPDADRNLAYADVAIPIGHQQFMLEPKIEARLLQSLSIVPSDVILEVGTGAGYLTALLAKSGQLVHSVDIFPDFTEQAREKLFRQNITNVILETGDASRGWDRHQPYDAIAVTGSFPIYVDDFQKQLKIGGRLFIVVGQPPIMEALLIQRVGEHEWHRESLFDTNVPPLINAPRPQPFVF